MSQASLAEPANQPASQPSDLGRSEPMIRVTGLTKRFGPESGGILAVDNVNLTVHRGEVLGFLGPNGAGKSTTMKMVTGFLGITSGSASVCGHDVSTEPIAVKSKIGYLPEGAPAYPDMTPESFLNFCAEVRGLHGELRRHRLNFVIDRTSLRGVLRQPIETLSKGFKRRVGLAQAILHDPEVLILDEPTDGLDPNQKHEVRGLIKEMAGNKAIVLSTHILEEVEAVCTRAVIIAKGKVVADGTPASLQARSKFHNALVVSVKPPPGKNANEIEVALHSVSGVAKVERAASGNGTGGSSGELRFHVYPRRGQAILADVGSLARTKGWEISELRVETGRLDDVFREITAGRD